MDRDAQGFTGVVLVRDVTPPMLSDIVRTLLDAYPSVRVHHHELPDGEEADLVIEGAVSLSYRRSARLSVDGDGAFLLEVSAEELSTAFVRLAIELACGSTTQRSWLHTLLEACKRIDELLERATDVAAAVFSNNGTFDDWRVAFTEGRFEEAGDPLTSPLAVGDEGATMRSQVASTFVDGTQAEDGHPFTRLVAEYGLDGRDVDILLLCLVHELDARYGRRYAYLQRDLGLEAPTVDLIAALLARDAVERVATQRSLISGNLVHYGLVTLGPEALPHRNQVVALDRSVRRILLGDERAAPGQLVIDPRATARSDAGYVPPPASGFAIDAVKRGTPVHFYGGVAADRRAAALDVAHGLGKRLLVVTHTAMAENPHWEAQRLRRECVRLRSCALVEQIPSNAAGWQAELAELGATVISAGDALARPVDGTTHQRLNLEVVGPAGQERATIWGAASRWTGISVAGSTGALTARRGVTADRAVAALVAAGVMDGSTQVAADTVAAALSQATIDDADGLLYTSHSRLRLSDLVVAPETERALRHALARIRNRDEVIQEGGWNQHTSRLTGTYLLFAGPPGTGKTMAAEGLAGELNLPVQYLEISALFSRWVGDFEAAVDKVFAAAAASQSLLVVNEADAILGPRTEVVHGQDRYANAGTSHILSRLEQFTGHVVFTSNLVGPNHIDPAFHRRLTNTIRFLPPDEAQRRKLWDVVWPTQTRDGHTISYRLAAAHVFDELARDHAISGASIANTARTATYLAAEAGSDMVTITERHLRDALAMELGKIGDFRSLMSARSRR